MAQGNGPDPNSARKLIVAAGGVAVAVVVVLSLRLATNGGSGRAGTDADSAESSARDRRAPSARVGRLDEDSRAKGTAATAVKRTTGTVASKTDATTAGPHAEVPVSRDYRVDDFRDPKMDMTGYKLDGLEITSAGLTLAAAPDGKKEGIRKGVLESPTLPLSFASNYMMPLWKAKTNEGSGLTVEMAISPDGQDWSSWFTLGPNADEISATYPDGRPNPNYGYQGGEGIANGTRLYSFARYRVTMTSGDATQDPFLEAFRVYYVDSTGPDGVLADQAYSGSGSGTNP